MPPGRAESATRRQPRAWASGPSNPTAALPSGVPTRSTSRISQLSDSSRCFELGSAGHTPAVFWPRIFGLFSVSGFSYGSRILARSCLGRARSCPGAGARRPGLLRHTGAGPAARAAPARGIGRASGQCPLAHGATGARCGVGRGHPAGAHHRAHRPAGGRENRPPAAGRDPGTHHRRLGGLDRRRSHPRPGPVGRPRRTVRGHSAPRGQARRLDRRLAPAQRRLRAGGARRGAAPVTGARRASRPARPRTRRRLCGARACHPRRNPQPATRRHRAPQNGTRHAPVHAGAIRQEPQSGRRPRHPTPTPRPLLPHHRRKGSPPPSHRHRGSPCRRPGASRVCAFRDSRSARGGAQRASFLGAPRPRRHRCRRRPRRACRHLGWPRRRRPRPVRN